MAINIDRGRRFFGLGFIAEVYPCPIIKERIEYPGNDINSLWVELRQLTINLVLFVAPEQS